MPRRVPLADPAKRDWLIAMLRSGVRTPKSLIKELGIKSMRTVERYRRAHPEFDAEYLKAKEVGDLSRREFGDIAPRYRPPPEDSPPPLSPVPPVPRTVAVGPAPEIDGHDLARVMLEVIINRANEETPIVVQAMKSLTVLAVHAPPRAVEHDDEPVVQQAGDSDSRPKVLMLAPDNGSYAPGCGPVEPDDADIADVEVVDGNNPGVAEVAQA